MTRPRSLRWQAVRMATATLARILGWIAVVIGGVAVNVWVAARYGAWVPAVAAVETVLFAWGLLYVVALDTLRSETRGVERDDPADAEATDGP